MPRMLLMLRLVPFMLMLLLSVVLRVLLSVLLVRVLVCRGRRQAPQPEEHMPRERGHFPASLGWHSGQYDSTFSLRNLSPYINKATLISPLVCPPRERYSIAPAARAHAGAPRPASPG